MSSSSSISNFLHKIFCSINKVLQNARSKARSTSIPPFKKDLEAKTSGDDRSVAKTSRISPPEKDNNGSPAKGFADPIGNRTGEMQETCLHYGKTEKKNGGIHSRGGSSGGAQPLRSADGLITAVDRGEPTMRNFGAHIHPISRKEQPEFMYRGH